MPPAQTVDASADDRVARRRRVVVEHLVLALVLVGLYAVSMLVALGHAGPG